MPQIKEYQSQQAAIASYDYVDIAAGTGIINFYAGCTQDGASAYNYLLSNNRFYTNSVTLSAATDAAGATVIMDLDFDVQINTPTTIGGKVVLNVPFAITNGITGYVVAYVRKWDGTTETEITSAECNHASATGTQYYMRALYLNIPPTVFKIGEYLRLTIQCHGSPGGGVFYLAADPMGRTTGFDATGAVPSTLIFQVSTKIDL